MKCSEEICDGDVDLSRMMQVRDSSLKFVDAAPCQKCRRLVNIATGFGITGVMHQKIWADSNMRVTHSDVRPF